MEACCEAAVASFKEGTGKIPYEWQLEAITHLLKMEIDPILYKPGPVLLVRSTGGGKSAVCDTIGYTLGGVILTIVPLLSCSCFLLVQCVPCVK